MKRLSQILCMLVLSLTLVGFVSPCFNFAVAAVEPERYDLVASTYNSEPGVVKGLYNIDENRRYSGALNPFDTETESHMPGYSFALNTADEFNQIIDQYVTPKKGNIIPVNTNKSLFIWIYFDQTLVHDLIITLQYEGGATAVWKISSTNLTTLLKKNGQEGLELLPYGWNRFEFPFAAATVDGEIEEGGVYKEIERLYVNFTSPEMVEGMTFSRLRFYDIYISDSVVDDEITVLHTNYSNYSFNFIDDDFANSLILGDTIKLKSFAEAVNYAYYGDRDLVAEKDRLEWRIMVDSPSSSSAEAVSWGAQLEFNEEGTWRIFYQCIDAKISKFPIVSGYQIFNISKVNGLYFDHDTFKMNYGESYVINVHISRIFTEVSEINYIYDAAKLRVEDLGEGRIRVTPLVSGNIELTAEVEGKRTARPEASKYSVSVVIVGGKPKSSHKVLKIVLYCALGVIGALLIGLLIKSLVNSRKNDVK